MNTEKYYYRGIENNISAEQKYAHFDQKSKSCPAHNSEHPYEIG